MHSPYGLGDAEHLWHLRAQEAQMCGISGISCAVIHCQSIFSKNLYFLRKHGQRQLGSYIFLLLYCTLPAQSQNFSRFYELQDTNNRASNWVHGLALGPDEIVVLEGGNCEKTQGTCGGFHILNQNGDVLEAKLFSDLLDYRHYPAFRVTHCSDGDFVTSGLEALPGGTDGDRLRMWALKFTPQGEAVWLNTFDSPLYEDEDANEVLETPTKDGYYLNADVGQDFTYFYKSILRMDGQGRKLWQRPVLNGQKYMMRGNMEILHKTPNRMAMCYTSGPGAPLMSTWLTLMDTTAQPLWSKRLVKIWDGDPITKELPNGNLLVVTPLADTFVPGEGSPVVLFQEVDLAGKVVKDKHLPPRTAFYEVNDMMVTRDDKLVLVGKYRDAQKTSNWIGKYDLETYTPIWQRHYRLPQNVYDNDYQGFFRVAERPDGGLVLGGMIDPFPEEDRRDLDAWVFTLDPDGCFEPGCGQELIFLPNAEVADLPEGKPLAVWPNPTAGPYTVFRTGDSLPQKLRLALYDALGRSWATAAMEKGDNELRMDTEGLPPGSYWLSAQGEEGGFWAVKLLVK